DGPTVRRAVANLVDNAVKHAPAGSAAQVDVEVTEAEARVSVTEHGPGVPEHEQEHICQRFWRGRGDAGGTRLRLPLAGQVAPARGGRLTVESPGPAGDCCVFRLTLRR